MPPPMLRTANHPFVPGTSRKYLLLLFPCICPACTLFFFFPVLVQYVPCSSFFLYLSSMCHPLLFPLYQSSVYPVLFSFSMYLTNVYLVLLPCTCLVCTLFFFFHEPVQCVPSSFSMYLSSVYPHLLFPCTCLVCTLFLFFHAPVLCVLCSAYI